MSWYNESGAESNIAISSRIRIARNIKKMPFTHKMSKEDLQRCISLCRDAFANNTWLSKEFDWLDIENMPSLERQKLVEKHLISPQLLQNIEGRAIILSKDEKISIMINEEDHIRIQAISSGLELETLLAQAEAVADAMGEAVEYSYSAKLGYLTSCPTNIGTGVRASVMMHLPSLTESGYMSQLLAAIGRMGIAIRGLYGEGSNAVGNIYQVSNQVTLGLSEQDIVKRILGIIQNILDKERDTRKMIAAAQGIQLEDRVWRSWGIMKYAKVLSSGELLEFMSDVRMGMDLGIIPTINPELLNGLLIETSPAHIAALLSENAGAHERDKKRAEIVNVAF